MQQSPYCVLTLDGGGIRGLVSTVLLGRLSAAQGLNGWLERTDLLAGTSTGGLIALGIAFGMTLDDIRNLLLRTGPRVFRDSWVDNVRDLGQWVGAQYSLRPLRRALHEIFGDARLGDLRRRVLIPAFDLDNEDPDPARRTWKPKFFHNQPGEGNDADVRIADVALYTCAAPTYFPSANGYIDGGVFANNPALCALAQTQDRRHPPNPDLDNVVLFSVGTGLTLQFIRGRTHDWGYTQWARPLVHLMLDGAMGIADYQCRQLLRDRYHRLAPVFPPGRAIAMDEVRKIPQLLEFAESVPVEATVSWLQGYWRGAEVVQPRRIC